MEVGQAEVLFAQKLACGEPNVRRKAFKKLEFWLKARSTKGNAFTKDDFLKLWKGLYYCLWLQDKPLHQELLVDNMTKLLDVLTHKEEKLLFIETFFDEMSTNWYSLDQWRMDKFMMFYRRFFRRILFWLKSCDWENAVIDDVFSILNRTVWNACPEAYPEGLKTHFASIYLDELDNAAAGELSYEQTFKFLNPYIELLRIKTLSDIFLDTILVDIFKSLLEFVADEMQKNVKSTKEDKFLAIDLEKIKTALFEVGKSPTVISQRRSRIYKYVKQYEQLINGVNPFYVEVPEMDELNESDIEKAAETLLKKGGKKNTKKRKIPITGDSDDEKDDSDDAVDPFIEERHKKLRRKNFNKKSKRNSSVNSRLKKPKKKSTSKKSAKS